MPKPWSTFGKLTRSTPDRSRPVNKLARLLRILPINNFDRRNLYIWIMKVGGRLRELCRRIGL